MLKKTTLMMLAATLAPLPLYAADALQSVAALIAPAEAPAATLQQRAAKFAAAALLPVDVEMAIVLPNVAENVGLFDADSAEMISCVDSIALGLGDGLEQSLAALQSFTTLLNAPAAGTLAAFGWSGAAKESLQSLIAQTGIGISNRMGAKAAAQLAGVVIHPIYLVVSPKAGQEEQLKAAVDMLMQQLPEFAKDTPGVELAQNNGTATLKIDGKTIAESILENGDDDPMAKAIADEVAKRTFYVQFSMQGDSAAVVLCENLEAVHFAANAESSVLATAPWSGADAHLADNIFFAISGTAELAATMDDAPAAKDLLQGMSEIFKVLGAQDSENAAAFQAAAQGIVTLSQECGNMIPATTKPTFTLAWGTPGQVNVSVSNDAKGVTYTPGKLALTGMADAPQNILYVESTGMSCPSRVDMPLLTDAGGKVLQGVAASLAEENQAELAGMLGGIQMFLPELTQVKQALATVGQGLGNGGALIIDNAGAPAPYLGAPVGSTIPRIVYYSAVTDRAKLGEGWDLILKAAGSAMGKMGVDPGLVSALPIVSATAGNMASYSVALPFFSQDMGLGLTVSDGALVLGSSSMLNSSVMESATGSAEFAGTVFSLKFGPLAKAARTLADMQPDEQNDDDTDSCEDSEDVAGDIAETLEEIAETIDTLQGTSTIQDGLHTLYIQVYFKD